MSDFLDVKFLLASGAVILSIVGYVAYFRDLFAGKTKPHLYTWLIWAITQGTATAVLLYGGGKYGSFSLIIGTMLVTSICFLSFSRGTKNITGSDTAILALALLAIVVWWWLDSPLAAVIMVSIIDGFGYIPTFRKAFEEPRSETVSFWIVMAIVNSLSIAANDAYNALTITYLATLAVGNATVAVLCLVRRKAISKH